MVKLMMFLKLLRSVNNMEFHFMLIQQLEDIFYHSFKWKENIILNLGILELME